MVHILCTMLITVSSAAKILDTSEGTVRRLERKGELLATRTDTGLRLFERATVQKLAHDRATRRAASSGHEAA
jgi:excisionase family DNA binding protein